MVSINRTRRLGNHAFIRCSAASQATHRHQQLLPDPEILVDGQRLNKYLNSLEGLSGQ